MCRFIVYKSEEPIRLSNLVTKPRHSIINQAFESKLRFPSSRPMNADGFGIGWYDPPSNPSSGALEPHQTADQRRSAATHHARPGVVVAAESGSPRSAPPLSPCPRAISPINASVGPSRPPSAAAPIQPIVGAGSGVEGKEVDASETVVNELEEVKDKESQVVNEAEVGRLADKDAERRAKAAELARTRQLERELELEKPCIFKSISPAWSNTNLINLAEKIRSPLVFAHVRATTIGGAPSEENCHPWSFGRLMWMHNGEITGFAKIKRALQAILPDEIFLYPQGYTDSEWSFAVFLSMLKDPHARSFTHTELRDAMMATIKKITGLCKEAGVTGPSLLNFVVSDGQSVVATRYISSRTQEAASLFFSSGTSFDEYTDGGAYRMTKSEKRERLILIASEPLTFERSDWMEVKTNYMLVITPKMNLLQIPIIDEYWVPPQDPASAMRSADFAIQMGFGHGFAYRDKDITA